MKANKTLSVLLAGLLLTSTLAACGDSGSGDNSTAETDNTGKTEISVFTWGYPAEKEAREKQMELFNEQHDDIVVSLEVSPDYDKQLDAMMAANDAPDVFEISSDWYHIRSDLGQAMDLNPLIEESGFDTSVFSEDMYGSLTTFDGKQEGLPIGKAAHVMAINKDLWAQTGMELPGDSWTWDQALEAAQKMTSGEGAEKVYGMADHWTYQQTAAYIYGGRFTDEKFTEIQMDSPESIKGFQFITDLMFKYQVMPDVNAAQGMTSAQRFYAGMAGMCPMNAWETPEFAKNIGDTFDWDIYPMPTTEEAGGVPTSWYIVEGYSIWIGTKNTDAAWEFVSWVTSEDEAMKLASTAAIPPTEASLTYFNENTTIEGKTLNMKAFTDVANSGCPSPFGGNYAEIATALANFWNDLALNPDAQKDVTDSVTALSEEISGLLDEINASR